MNYKEYLQTLIEALDSVDIGQVNLLTDRIKDLSFSYGWIYVIGNGGSAATASHFAADITKNVEREVHAFSFNNVPHLTAIANDEGYDRIFTDWLASFDPGGADLLIAISTSGNSLNVLAAVDWAKKLDITTVGLTGFDGGKLREMCDLSIHVDCDIIEIVEDCHHAILHSIVKALKK